MSPLEKFNSSVKKKNKLIYLTRSSAKALSLISNYCLIKFMMCPRIELPPTVTFILIRLPFVNLTNLLGKS